MYTAVYIDFDGVLCDSVDECYASSAFAYYEMVQKKTYCYSTISGYEKFKEYRPYIRTGADYVFLQKIMEQDEKISDQNDFDRRLSVISREEYTFFHQAFYAGRKHILHSWPEFWYSLNRPYPGVLPLMKKMGSDNRVHILSTKKAAFIQKIVNFWGVEWPISRILYAASQTKVQIMQSATKKGSRVFFIDDQIDTVKQCAGCPAIDAHGASWGYVANVRNAEVPMMDLEEFISLYDRIVLE